MEFFIATVLSPLISLVIFDRYQNLAVQRASRILTLRRLLGVASLLTPSARGLVHLDVNAIACFKGRVCPYLVQYRDRTAEISADINEALIYLRIIKVCLEDSDNQYPEKVVAYERRWALTSH